MYHNIWLLTRVLKGLLTNSGKDCKCLMDFSYMYIHKFFFVSDLHPSLNMFVVIEYSDGHSGGWGQGSRKIRGGKWEKKGWEVGEERL